MSFATLFRHRAVLVLLICCTCAPAFAQKRDPFRDARDKMVREAIEREGITNPRVVAAMRQVPRHEYVDQNQRSSAYVDCALPIGHKQTISPPFVVAYMTQTIEPQPDDRILEIGTGSGYQASVLANLCKEVYSIEIVPQLGTQAATRLKKLGYENVMTKVGDGYLGWPEHAPFDKIIVTCSPESVPQPLVDQLKEGGMLLIPLGERYQQVFHKFEKKDGKLTNTKLIPTMFVPMTGESEEKRQVKPDPQNPKLLNGSFEDDVDEDGKTDVWYYQRLMTIDHKEAQDGKNCALFENSNAGRISQALQATAIDGSKIAAMHLELDYKLEYFQAGSDAHEVPGFVALFYDENRKNLEPVFVPFQAFNEWRTASRTFAVPAKAREMIVRVGLCGAAGKLYVDNIRLTFQPR